jgi:hypothetical protein
MPGNCVGPLQNGVGCFKRVFEWFMDKSETFTKQTLQISVTVIGHQLRFVEFLGSWKSQQALRPKLGVAR